MQVQHILSGIEGCGNKVEEAIKDQLAQIFERIVDVLKNEKLDSADEYVHLLNAFCWEFSPEDHHMLSKLKIFDTLWRGNGDRMHPLARAWGREETHFQIELDRLECFSLATR